jgi:hypothetical protein
VRAQFCDRSPELRFRINEMSFESERFQEEIFYIKVEKSIAVKTGNHFGGRCASFYLLFGLVIERDWFAGPDTAIDTQRASREFFCI